MTDITPLLDRRLLADDNDELLRRLRDSSNWQRAVVSLAVQEGSSAPYFTRLAADRSARHWVLTDETNDVLASYDDGVLRIGAEPDVKNADFEHGPTLALQLLFPWRLPLWGRAGHDDSVPLVLSSAEGGVSLISVHRADPAMASGVILDMTFGIATRLVRQHLGAVLEIESIA